MKRIPEAATECRRLVTPIPTYQRGAILTRYMDRKFHGQSFSVIGGCSSGPERYLRTTAPWGGFALRSCYASCFELFLKLGRQVVQRLLLLIDQRLQSPLIRPHAPRRNGAGRFFPCGALGRGLGLRTDSRPHTLTELGHRLKAVPAPEPLLTMKAKVKLPLYTPTAVCTVTLGCYLHRAFSSRALGRGYRCTYSRPRQPLLYLAGDRVCL